MMFVYLFIQIKEFENIKNKRVREIERERERERKKEKKKGKKKGCLFISPPPHLSALSKSKFPSE